jgi:hypothetical protein
MKVMMSGAVVALSELADEMHIKLPFGLLSTAARHLRSPGDVRVGVGVRVKKRSYSAPSKRILVILGLYRDNSNMAVTMVVSARKNTQT